MNLIRHTQFVFTRRLAAASQDSKETIALLVPVNARKECKYYEFLVYSFWNS